MVTQQAETKTVTSIFINAKQWRDKIHGSTYFSAQISINGEIVGYLPFQYGYENAYQWEAIRWLYYNGYIPALAPLWSVVNSGPAVYSTIKDGKKAEVKAHGTI